MDNNITELIQLLEIKENKIRALEALIANLRGNLRELRQGLQILSQPPYEPDSLQAFLITQYEQEINDLRRRNFELNIEVEVCQTAFNRNLPASYEEAQSSNVCSVLKSNEGKAETSNKRGKKPTKTIDFLQKWKGKGKKTATSEDEEK